MAVYQRTDIAEGIGYTSIIDPKFKTQRVQIMFITELKKDTASENAIAVGVLGSSNCKYKNISEITAKLNSLYGANINIDILKIADYQRLCIGVSSINSKYALEGEDINAEVLSILLDCIFSPNVIKNGEGKLEFAHEPFDFRKRDILDSIEAEINNKRAYAVMQAQKSIYNGENSANSSYGTKETAESVTAESAYKAYKKLLKTAKIEIYYVGSEENTNAENAIFKAFSRIERIPSAVKYYSHSPLKQSICRTEERLDVNQCKMVLAFKGKSDDFDAVRLMNTIFGATPFSKLFINVREKQSLCYYCTSQYNRYKKTLMVDCGIEEENIEKTEKEIIKQLEDIKNGEFSDEDISNSVLSIINSLKGVGDTSTSYINWYFGCLANGELLEPSESVEKIKAVTRERIIEAAKSFELDTVYVMRGE